MLSGWRRYSSSLHCCVVVARDFHWHRYALFMACAPHLSFLVMFFSLMMDWIARPRVGCVEGIWWSGVFGFVFGGCRGWVIWGVGVGKVGKSVLMCCRATLMFLGICLYRSWNSSGVRMSMVFGFWICAIVVMPNIYSLFKCFWIADLVVVERLAYDEVFRHACSRGVFLMGNARLAVVT